MNIIRMFSIIIKLIALVCFLLMMINITFYYGFYNETLHHKSSGLNPFQLSVTTIWISHLVVGFLAGMTFSRKNFILTGFMGLFCAALITGTSFIYFGWRSDLITLEFLIPLVVGILPTMKLYDFLKNRINKNDESI